MADPAIGLIYFVRFRQTLNADIRLLTKRTHKRYQYVTTEAATNSANQREQKFLSGKGRAATTSLLRNVLGKNKLRKPPNLNCIKPTANAIELTPKVMFNCSRQEFEDHFKKPEGTDELPIHTGGRTYQDICNDN